MDAGSAGWNGHEVQIDFAENASTADAADGNKVALAYLRSNQSMMEVTQRWWRRKQGCRWSSNIFLCSMTHATLKTSQN
jgi:hypothetical protein